MPTFLIPLSLIMVGGAHPTALRGSHAKMGRLPFHSDPIHPESGVEPTGDVALPTPSPGVRGDPPFTVSAVAAMVRGVLADYLPSKVRVIGEVSNFSGRSHWFFSLKDEQATLSCVCFASSARRVGFPVADGLQVIATGRIDYYDAQGRLQLYVDKLEPVGQGALELRFRALCEELRTAGYFDPARKKPLPAMPRRVAVVTSRSAAALQDVINTAGQRWAGCGLLLYDVPVQGDAAAPRISAALRALSSDGARLGIDAIILTRGGGSIEDLWAFNERAVADAVFECSLPIVAAIGHETDTTIAELVADMRCATPTQAAMTLIPDRQALAHQVDQLSSRLTLLLKRQYALNEQRLAAVMRHPIFSRPARMLELADQRLESLVQRLAMGLPRRLERSRDRLEASAKQLESVGPQNVLGRGYSYTLGQDGRVLRSVTQAVQGDVITTVVADGRFRSQIESGDGGGKPLPVKPARPRRVKPKLDESQPGLFYIAPRDSRGAK